MNVEETTPPWPMRVDSHLITQDTRAVSILHQIQASSSAPTMEIGPMREVLDLSQSSAKMAYCIILLAHASATIVRKKVTSALNVQDFVYLNLHPGQSP